MSDVIATPIITIFSTLSNIIEVAIFPKLCFWRLSLCSNLGGIEPGKLYRATLILALSLVNSNTVQQSRVWQIMIAI